MASSRLVSLDVFRGATMAAMVIVNNPGDWGQMYAPLKHAEWHGWTPTDLIFPFFVFIMGVSITLSARSVAPVSVILRRAALIYAMGFFLALYPRFDFSIVRVMGVLPRLALAYLGTALIFRALQQESREDQGRAAITIGAVCLLIYWALLMFVAPPGGVAGDLTPAGNLGAWLDRTIIGEAHLWRTAKTWDPEGLLGTLPTIGTALMGVAAGIIITSERSSSEKVATLLAGAGVALAIGLVWDRSFPINKNLWTSSYAIFTSGAAAMALAACYWIIDVRGAQRWTHPFVVFGTNALVLFVASGLLVKTLVFFKVTGGADTEVTVYRWLYEVGFQPFGSPKNTSLAFSLAMLAVMYGLCAFLYRRRWFLRV